MGEAHGPHRLTDARLRAPEDGPPYRLFDVRPGDEKTHVSPNRPEAVYQLEEQLRCFLASGKRKSADSVPPSENREERLRQLGYM
jgi:hypothetical protein